MGKNNVICCGEHTWWLTGSQYDNVLVNSITYTPHLIVNSTLLDWAETGGRAIKVLTALSVHNDTLLDLSGVHFNVTHFAHSQTLMAPKPVAPYMTIGSGIRSVHTLLPITDRN